MLRMSYDIADFKNTLLGPKQRMLFGAANSSTLKKSRREAKQLIKLAFPSEKASVAAADDAISGGRQARERLRRAAKRLHRAPKTERTQSNRQTDKTARVHMQRVRR